MVFPCLIYIQYTLVSCLYNISYFLVLNPLFDDEAKPFAPAFYFRVAVRLWSLRWTTLNVHTCTSWGTLIVVWHVVHRINKTSTVNKEIKLVLFKTPWERLQISNFRIFCVVLPSSSHVNHPYSDTLWKVALPSYSVVFWSILGHISACNLCHLMLSIFWQIQYL